MQSHAALPRKHSDLHLFAHWSFHAGTECGLAQITRSHASAHESVADIPHTVTHAFAVGSCLFSLFVLYIENGREKKERSERERVLFLFVCSLVLENLKDSKIGETDARSLLWFIIQTRDRIERSTVFHSIISLHPSVEDECITRERTQKKKKEEDFLRARDRERGVLCVVFITFANPPIRFNNRSEAHTRSHAKDASSSVTVPLLCSFSPFLTLFSLFLNMDLTTKSAPAPAAGAPTK